MFNRWLEKKWRHDFSASFVQIVFGARQTGKSTLIRGLLPADATIIDLADPEERARYLNEPGRFIALCKGLPWRLGISTRDNTAQWTAWTNLPWLVLVAWLAATLVARLRENATTTPVLLDPPVEAA